MEQEFTFEGQRPDEKVLIYRHQHPWVLAKAGFVDVLIALAIMAFFLAFGLSKTSLWILAIGLVSGFYYTFNCVYLFRNVMFIITDQRIINILQSSIFGRKVQETELINIYNLSYNVRGVIRNFLDFGNIELTTEGDVNDRIILKNVPVPHEVFDKLSKARKNAFEKYGKEVKERPILR